MPDLPAWPAPTARGPVHATVRVPGSKSLTNRYLVLAALAEGPSRLRAPLRSRDTLLMAQALRSLGVAIEDHLDGVDWLVLPGPLQGGGTIDCGLAGTVMRFLPPLAALADASVRFEGDEQATARPMRPILQALTDLGVHVDGADRGSLPFTVTGPPRGGEVHVDASASSQFVSGLLLSAPRYPDGVVVVNTAADVPSGPHLKMTVETLRDCSVEVDDSQPGRWQVWPGPVTPLDVVVEPDLSNAAPFVAAAAVCGGRVTVPDWPQHTTQAGDQIRDLLDQMGAEPVVEPSGLTVTGSGELYGLQADLHDVGELTPVLAAMCALASSPSHLHGIAHLRGHETDRLHALATELSRLGGDVTQTADGLIIRPKPLRGGVFRTYHDHRMATAGAVIGLRVPGVGIENVATTAKTLPGFETLWTSMVAGG